MASIATIPDHLSLERTMDLGHGYVLLRPRDKNVFTATRSQEEKLYDTIGRSTIKRWGRLQLPNGQVARSVYKENKSTLLNQRVSRNVKVSMPHKYMSTKPLSQSDRSGSTTKPDLRKFNSFFGIKSQVAKFHSMLWLHSMVTQMITCSYSHHIHCMRAHT